jgi:hypothetical protein
MNRTIDSLIGFLAVGYVFTHAMHVHAQPANLSILGTSTASASSVLQAFVPNNARDGNRAGNIFWHSANAPVPDIYGVQHWYEIDLGTNYYLDRLQILPRNQLQDTVKNFRLEVYDTSGATVYSQMFLPTKTTGDRAWGTTAIRNVHGSRVRIIRDPPHTQYDRAITFAEFEVWGQSTPIPPNLALNRPTTSSTPLADAGPTGPELANDGDIAGHFWLESIFITDGTAGPYVGPFGNGHYWQTELAQPSAISYINLFARADDTSNNGPVRISILGADGTTVVASADTDLGGTDFNLARYNLTQTFPANPMGSYVRIESLDTSKKLVLAGVEVFGPPAAGVAGDYNGNGVVDAADYVIWRHNNGLTGGATTSQGDGTGDGNVDTNDYHYWRSRFGNTSGGGAALVGSSLVPEPASALLLMMSGILSMPSRKHRKKV